MKNIISEKKYTNALLEFINTEVINGNKELEGVITNNDNFINKENSFLYECFQALSKKHTIQEIESKISLWFPYGILISANDFSYEVVKKYTNHLSQKYNLIHKDLFFNPTDFFQTEIKDNSLEEIIEFFNQYKNNKNFLKNIENQLLKNEVVQLCIDEKKFLNSRLITNVNEKNKELLNFLLDNEIFNGNSKISYGGKEICLLEYLLLRSLTCSKEIIQKMMLQVNKNNLTTIKNNILSIDLSYLKNFKEEAENFYENMNLLDRRMIVLKFEEEDRGSTGSSSKGVVKI